VAPIYRGRRVSSQQLPIKFRVVGWYECVSVVRRVIALHYEIELQLQPERDSLNHFSSYEAGSRFRCILRGVMVGLVLYLLRLTTHSNDYSCILKRNFVIMEEPELSHYVHTRVCTKMGKAQLQQRSGRADLRAGREQHYSRTARLLGDQSAPGERKKSWSYKQGGCRGTEMKAGMECKGERREMRDVQRK
jgi:hypothetical protein